MKDIFKKIVVIFMILLLTFSFVFADDGIPNLGGGNAGLTGNNWKGKVEYIQSPDIVKVSIYVGLDNSKLSNEGDIKTSNIDNLRFIETLFISGQTNYTGKGIANIQINPYSSKLEQIKSLKAGNVVASKYNVDFEVGPYFQHVKGMPLGYKSGFVSNATELNAKLVKGLFVKDIVEQALATRYKTGKAVLDVAALIKDLSKWNNNGNVLNYVGKDGIKIANKDLTPAHFNIADSATCIAPYVIIIEPTVMVSVGAGSVSTGDKANYSNGIYIVTATDSATSESVFKRWGDVRRVSRTALSKVANPKEAYNC